MSATLLVFSFVFLVGWLTTFSALRRLQLRHDASTEAQRCELDLLNGQLRESQRFRGAFDGLPDGVVVTDGLGAVVLRNDAATRFVGARHSDAVVEIAIADLAAVATNGSHGARELELFGPPRRVLSLRSHPILDDGVTVGAVVWVRDVSDARRVEDMRRDFVANVSHELRTPVGALGLLAETIADETDTEIMRRFAKQMEREAIRLGNIIEDLLDLSVIESDEPPAFHHVDVGDIVYAAVNKVSGAADVAQISIHVLPCERNIMVSGDRRQLVSAIYNLLDNAVKYSDAESTVEVSAIETETAVMLSVRDRGIGIPSRDLERVFERFYRVDRARSRDTGGTGLGLAIVRHVAATHGGAVTVTSHEGEGSTFSFTVPVVHGTEPEDTDG